MTSIEFNAQLIKQSETLKGFALNLTRDKEDAMDLIQDTLLKAITYRERFSVSTNLKAWLITIMKNTFINNYRRSVLKNESIKEIKYLSSISDNTIETKINTKDINKAINLLQDEYKTPFKKYISGFKYHEIAEEMGVPIGTVKSRIFIARAKLSKRLSNKG